MSSSSSRRTADATSSTETRSFCHRVSVDDYELASALATRFAVRALERSDAFQNFISNPSVKAQGGIALGSAEKATSLRSVQARLEALGWEKDKTFLPFSDTDSKQFYMEGGLGLTDEPSSDEDLEKGLQESASCFYNYREEDASFENPKNRLSKIFGERLLQILLQRPVVGLVFLLALALVLLLSPNFFFAKRTLQESAEGKIGIGFSSVSEKNLNFKHLKSTKTSAFYTYQHQVITGSAFYTNPKQEAGTNVTVNTDPEKRVLAAALAGSYVSVVLDASLALPFTSLALAPLDEACPSFGADSERWFPIPILRVGHGGSVRMRIRLPGLPGFSRLCGGTAARGSEPVKVLSEESFSDSRRKIPTFLSCGARKISIERSPENFFSVRAEEAFCLGSFLAIQSSGAPCGSAKVVSSFSNHPWNLSNLGLNNFNFFPGGVLELCVSVQDGEEKWSRLDYSLVMPGVSDFLPKEWDLGAKLDFSLHGLELVHYLNPDFDKRPRIPIALVYPAWADCPEEGKNPNNETLLEELYSEKNSEGPTLNSSSPNVSDRSFQNLNPLTSEELAAMLGDPEHAGWQASSAASQAWSHSWGEPVSSRAALKEPKTAIKATQILTLSHVALSELSNTRALWADLDFSQTLGTLAPGSRLALCVGTQKAYGEFTLKFDVLGGAKRGAFLLALFAGLVVCLDWKANRPGFGLMWRVKRLWFRALWVAQQSSSFFFLGPLPEWVGFNFTFWREKWEEFKKLELVVMYVKGAESSAESDFLSETQPFTTSSSSDGYNQFSSNSPSENSISSSSWNVSQTSRSLLEHEEVSLNPASPTVVLNFCLRYVLFPLLRISLSTLASLKEGLTALFVLPQDYNPFSHDAELFEAQGPRGGSQQSFSDPSVRLSPILTSPRSPSNAGSPLKLNIFEEEEEGARGACVVCWTRARDTAFGCGHVGVPF